MEPGNCFLCHCAGGVHAQVAQYLEEVERKGQICEAWDSIHSNRTRIAESMPFASLLLLAAQKQQKGLGEEGPVRSEITSSSIIVIIIMIRTECWGSCVGNSSLRMFPHSCSRLGKPL